MNLNPTAKETASPDLGFAAEPIANPSEVVVIGRKAFLAGLPLATTLRPSPSCNAAATCTVAALLDSIKDSGKASSFVPLSDNVTAISKAVKLTIIAPPPAEKVSRNNHPFSPHFISDKLEGLRAAALKGLVQINVFNDNIDAIMGPVAAAIARTLPLYDSKSKKKDTMTIKKENAGVCVSFFNHQGVALDPASPLWASARAVAEGVRLAANLGDMPPAELDPDEYATVCAAVASRLAKDGANITLQEVKGSDLRTGGYGGIYGVGMAGRCPPRMIVMTYTPAARQWEANVGEEHLALCGKGVIYDTGGLGLKPKASMCGMKHDMGGSAGLLGGFMAAVELKVPQKITLILAIVENSIGPESFRNDDILTMKSGKTVEVNNTDAEGRLILSDCVNYASNSIGKVDVILDMATLTGAQGVCTGQKHAAILAKTKAIEDRVFAAGLRSGDLVYPMLYDRLLMSEFDSKVADMKNSVKNRNNAQASCAGHFIESHIDEAYEGDWVHVDMAGPDSKNERANGYGVALVLGLLKAPGFC